MKTAEVAYQREITRLIREILGDDYITINLNNLHISELDLCEAEGPAEVEFDLIVDGVIQHVHVVQEGVIACLFAGLLNTLSERFTSLANISLCRFSTRVKRQQKNRAMNISADERIGVEIAVTCGVKNIHFEQTTRSLLRSAVIVVIRAFETFINAELAIIKLRKAHDSYVERNRPDLIQAVSEDMATLVQIMPYDQIIANLNK